MSTDLATNRRRAALANLAQAHTNGTPKQRLDAASAALAVGVPYDQMCAAMGGMTLDDAFMRHYEAELASIDQRLATAAFQSTATHCRQGFALARLRCDAGIRFDRALADSRAAHAAATGEIQSLR